MNKINWQRNLILTLGIIISTMPVNVQSYELKTIGNVSLEEIYGGLSEYPAVYFIGIESVTFTTQRDWRGTQYCGRYYYTNTQHNKIFIYNWKNGKGFPYKCLDHELGHHYEHYFLSKNTGLSESFAETFTPLNVTLC